MDTTDEGAAAQMPTPETKVETPDKAIQASRDGMIQKVLAILIFIGFFSCIGALMTLDLPDAGHDVLLVLIGALGGAFGAIVNYYFGSSSGSAAKTAMARV